MKHKLRKLIRETIEEIFTSGGNDVWAWVSPDNKIINVPKLNHKSFIMRQYKNEDFGWDYERVFNKAMEDGWVRVIFENIPHEFERMLSLNGKDEFRVRQVLKDLFYNSIKYGNNSIYIDYENPRGSHVFSTATPEGKDKLWTYLNS